MEKHCSLCHKCPCVECASLPTSAPLANDCTEQDASVYLVQGCMLPPERLHNCHFLYFSQRTFREIMFLQVTRAIVFGSKLSSTNCHHIILLVFFLLKFFTGEFLYALKVFFTHICTVPAVVQFIL